MKITTSHVDGTSTIKISGDLVISGVAEAKPAIIAAMADAREIQLDLADIGDCDTAGIQLLLMARTSARAQGRPVTATIQSASFRAALQRLGIPAGCFDSQEGTH